MLDYTIGNCGITYFNGTYVHQGYSDGDDLAYAPYWKHETEDIWMCCMYYSGNEWIITDDASFISSFILELQPSTTAIRSFCYIGGMTSGYTEPDIGSYTGYQWDSELLYLMQNGDTLTVAAAPYLMDIFNTTDLEAFFNLTSVGYEDVFYLMNDIEWLGSSTYNGAGSSGDPFTGTFYGNNFTITTLNNVSGFSSDKVGGLINYSTGCNVYDLTIETYVRGDDCVGGLIGQLDAYTDCEIINVSVKASGYSSNYVVQGNSYTGGLIGLLENYNGSQVKINYCNTEGRVGNYGDGTFTARGGLIGQAFVRTDPTPNQIVITNCSTNTTLEAHVCCGGLIGLARADGNGVTEQIVIENCHATTTFIGKPDIDDIANFKLHGGFIGRTASYDYAELGGIVVVRECSWEADMDYSVNYTNSTYKAPSVASGFGDMNGWTIVEDCYCEINLVVPDYWYSHTTWEYNYGTYGGFVGILKWGALIKNCYCKGTITLPDWSISNTHYLFTASGATTTAFNGDYTKRYLDFVNSGIMNEAETHALIFDGDYFRITDSAGIVQWNNNTMPDNGFYGTSVPMSAGQPLSDVTFTGYGDYAGETITLSAKANTETRGRETGGFAGYTQGWNDGIEDHNGHCESCISFMETTNVKGGFMDRYYTTDGRCESTGDGRYYDSTLSPETEIHADYADQIEAKTSAEFSNKSGLPKLDFVESLSGETGWYMGHDGYPELMAFRPEIVNFNKLQNEIGALV